MSIKYNFLLRITLQFNSFYRTKPFFGIQNNKSIKNRCLIKKCWDYNFNLKLKSNLKKISTLRHNNTLIKTFVIIETEK
jgi:hypothetical protein